MKQSVIIIVILAIGLITQSSRCKKVKESEHCHPRITFVNNSGTDVYAEMSEGYPDTNYYRDLAPSPVLNPQYYKVDDTIKVLESRECVEFMFHSDSDKIMCFVWGASILENTPWDTVKKYNLYVKRYDLSLQDLNRMNWRIAYP